MRIKWLHLSDIHFNYKNFDSEILREEFVNRIKELSEREIFTHLILSGDLLFRNKHDVDRNTKTSEFINKLIEAMGITTERVIIVPGNHDHNRSCAIEIMENLSANKQEGISLGEATESLAEVEIENLLRAFDSFNCIYKSVFGVDYYTSYGNPHIIENSGEAVFLKLNTAWLEQKSGSPNSIYFGRMQMLELLQEHKCGSIRNIIAVGHHPLEEFAEEEKERILDLFSRYDIHLYLCGHQHVASVKYFENKDVLQIVCPGGYVDGHSVGGYVSGLVDTDCDIYKAEVYIFQENSWRICSELPEADDHGVYYFNTKSFRNSPGIAVVDLNLYGGSTSKQEIENALGTDNYEMVQLPTAELQKGDLDWEKEQQLVENTVKEIRSRIIKDKTIHIFPLASIPTLMYLGFLLQNNFRVIVHQRDRQGNRWLYNEKYEDVQYLSAEDIKNRNELVVVVSTSAPIDMVSVCEVLPRSIDAYDTFELNVKGPEIGHPLYTSGVKKIISVLFERLNQIATVYESIHFFGAVPAGMAVEIGRNMLKSLYANVFTYNFSKGKYHQAIIINGIDDGGRQPKSEIDGAVFLEQYNTSITMLPVLGEVACGVLSEAILERDEFIPVPTTLIGSGEYFVLKAHGDSMINAGISDGDYVVIRRQQTADDGKIVVAIVDDETNLKRLRHDEKNHKIILHSENEIYPDQIYDKLEIQGVAVMIMKML